jgi:hypothetical protein
MDNCMLAKKCSGAFFIYFCAAILAAAQTPPPSSTGSIPTSDLNQAKKIVQTFCACWKKLKIDSMYAMMGIAAREDMPKPKFLTIYGEQADKSGRLGSFSVKEAVPGDDGVVVKAALTFVKQKPPSAVNGIYNFHMIEENGKWKVKAVVPPIAPPEIEGSGGHPGE